MPNKLKITYIDKSNKKQKNMCFKGQKHTLKMITYIPLHKTWLTT